MLDNPDFKYQIHYTFVSGQHDIKNAYNFNTRIHIDDSTKYFQKITF